MSAPVNQIVGGVVSDTGGVIEQKAPIIGGIAGAMSYAGKTYRKDLKKRAKQLASGELGYSDAQRRQMRGEMQRASEASSAPVLEDLRRRGLSGGARDEAVLSIARQNQDAAAESMAGVNVASQLQAERSANQIRGELVAQRNKIQQDWERGAVAQGQSMQSVGDKISGGGMTSSGDVSSVFSSIG